jgi:hypothetical protein
MLFISFNISIITLAGKITKFFDGVDYSNCLWLFGLCCSLYFGRKISGNNKNLTLEGKIDGQNNQKEG